MRTVGNTGARRSVGCVVEPNAGAGKIQPPGGDAGIFVVVPRLDRDRTGLTRSLRHMSGVDDAPELRPGRGRDTSRTEGERRPRKLIEPRTQTLRMCRTRPEQSGSAGCSRAPAAPPRQVRGGPKRPRRRRRRELFGRRRGQCCTSQTHLDSACGSRDCRRPVWRSLRVLRSGLDPEAGR